MYKQMKLDGQNVVKIAFKQGGVGLNVSHGMYKEEKIGSYRDHSLWEPIF